MSALKLAAPIEHRTVMLRGHRVMLDADLAEVYGVTTKCLNEQLKRNCGRVPAGTIVRLTRDENALVVANCDHIRRPESSAALPHALAGHGMAHFRYRWRADL